MSVLPQLVVFDMAGTTVQDGDGEVNRCLRESLEAAGLLVPADEVNAVMGLPKPDALRIVLGPRLPNPKDRDAMVEATHADFLARMIRYYAEDPAVAPVPGAVETFAALRKAGVLVTLDTGFSRHIANIVLTRFGWTDGDVIDGSITSDEVLRGRPHPDLVQALMTRFGITDPARVAKVGDTPYDLQEGTSAGCGWVIGVTKGSHTAEQLAPYPHTHLIPTVADLPALFGV